MISTITHIKNSLEGLNSIFGQAEERVSNLRNRKKKEYGKMKNLRDMWTLIKHNNICIMAIPEEEEINRIKNI